MGKVGEHPVVEKPEAHSNLALRVHERAMFDPARPTRNRRGVNLQKRIILTDPQVQHKWTWSSLCPNRRMIALDEYHCWVTAQEGDSIYCFTHWSLGYLKKCISLVSNGSKISLGLS